MSEIGQDYGTSWIVILQYYKLRDMLILLDTEQDLAIVYYVIGERRDELCTGHDTCLRQ